MWCCYIWPTKKQTHIASSAVCVYDFSNDFKHTHEREKKKSETILTHGWVRLLSFVLFQLKCTFANKKVVLYLVLAIHILTLTHCNALCLVCISQIYSLYFLIDLHYKNRRVYSSLSFIHGYDLIGSLNTVKSKI